MKDFFLKGLGDAVAPDKLLQITLDFKKDNNPDKINLGVGLYFDKNAKPFVFDCVKNAEHDIINDKNRNQNYISALGLPTFLSAMKNLVFENMDKKVAIKSTDGGTQGLSLGAKIAKKGFGVKKVIIGTPSWPNHYQIFKGAGFKIKEYNHLSNNVANFDALIKILENENEKALVLLHSGMTHNPTGVNFTRWDEIAEIFKKKKNLLCFFDCAYAGFDETISEDTKVIRDWTEKNINLLVSFSFSKNMSLYKQRTGALLVPVSNNEEKNIIEGHMMKAIRIENSMSASHGQEIVAKVCSNKTEKEKWLKDLRLANLDIRQRREKLAQIAGSKFEFIKNQRGLFSMLGINKEVVAELRDKYAIYMAESSRINIGGLAENSIDYFAKVLKSL